MKHIASKILLVFAPMVAQASFLGDIAANPAKVVSSPYATGGDVILALSANEYVHIFTNTAAAATFTPAADLRARVLVVAGGGAAGSVTQSPGGGGAGGMVEESGVALAADTPYTATVGAGGAATTGQNGNKNGGNSSFAGGAVSLTAIGGGRGSDWGANKAGSGGSGGGAGSNGSVTSGGAGTAGQGHEGGGVLASPYNVGGGGGGGAGAPGGTVMIYASESPLGAIHGGLGGDGLSSDILGFEQYFAGGGGGYYNKTAANGCIRSPGGLGGGGSGGISGDTAGENGEDGLGGGGGGGLAKAASGRGGSGIVVVRYVVWTDSAPLLRASTATAKGGSFATVAGALGAYGEGESSAAVKMRYWKTSAPAETAVATVLELEGNDALDAAFEKTVGGFEPETEYRYALYAEGANGSSAEQTGSFTTFSTSIGSAASGGEASVVDGVDRVHVFTEDGTFTATGSGYAEILVVGGGGAGGSGPGPGGGGGGGGVVHATEVLLEPGVYAVTIGAGGTMASYATSSKTPGGNSLITSEGGATTNFIAYGGGCGVGWDDNTATGSSGASGGGGARNRRGTEALAVYGQGHVGGDPQNDYRPGGGGGAGTKGANGSASGVTPSGAGAGGAGLAISITGTRAVYGSGGGGGARSNADVMAPGGENGGNGAYWTVPATAGVDGTGGGGGGCNASAATRIAGNGGSGVVIIRYTDFSLAGDAPVLAVHPDDATVAPCSVVLPIDVTSAGTGASTVSLTAAWGYAADDLSVGSTALSDFIGSGEISAAGLLPGTECFFSIVADNGQSGGTATWTGSFATAPMFSEALTYTAAGGVLGFTVDGAATADSQRLELWVGPDASSMTNQATYTDASLLAAGAHTIQPFAAEQFGTDAAILLRHISVVDGMAFTNDTAVLSTTIQDGATYTWKEDVADGDWCDAANWTASTTPGRGWPTAGSIAMFQAMTATCRVDRAVTIYQTQFTAKGNVTLRGTASGASLTTRFNRGKPFSEGALTLDALDVVVPSQSGTQVKLDSAASLVITNGASFTSAIDCALNNSTASLVIAAGSTFSARVLGGVGTSGKAMPKMIVAGTAEATYDFRLTYDGAANKPALNLVLDGPSARVKTGNGNFNAANSNATVTVNLTPGAYSATEALIKATGGSTKMANSGCTITFEAPETAASKNLGKCDILVADWSRSSINTALVEFGEVDREGSYFYYTTSLSDTVRYKSAAEVTADSATVKCIWYHHKGPGGFHLSVR